MNFWPILIAWLSTMVDQSLGDDWNRPTIYVKDLEFDWNTVLAIHNYYRRKVADGEISRQPAGLIPDLKYDHELAKAAQEWSRTCKNDEHSDNRQESKAGENMAYNFPPPGKVWTIEEKLNDSVTGWFNEQEDFTYGSGGGIILHYTQLIWANTKKVGCGLSKCQHWKQELSKNDGWFLVCQYLPRANWPGECEANDNMCYQDLKVETPYPTEGKPLEPVNKEGPDAEDVPSDNGDDDKAPLPIEDKDTSSAEDLDNAIDKDQDTLHDEDQDTSHDKDHEGTHKNDDDDGDYDYQGDKPGDEKDEKVVEDPEHQHRSKCYDAAGSSANKIACDSFLEQRTPSGEDKYTLCWSYKCRVNKVRSVDLPFCQPRCNEAMEQYFKSDEGRRMIEDFESESANSGSSQNVQRDQHNQQQNVNSDDAKDQTSDCYDPGLSKNHRINCDKFQNMKTASGRNKREWCWAYKCRANKVRQGDLPLCNSLCDDVTDEYFRSEEGRKVAEEFDEASFGK